MNLNKTFYETFVLEDLIERHCIATEKPMVFFRSWGWNNTTDVDKINASMEQYKSIFPIDIFNALKDSEYVFVEADNLQEVIDFCVENLPKSQAECLPELYIFYCVYNHLGQSLASNE